MDVLHASADLVKVYLDLAAKFRLRSGCPPGHRRRARHAGPRPRAGPRGVLFPQHLIYPWPRRTRDVFFDEVPRLPRGVSEVFAHPVLDGGELRAYSPEYADFARRRRVPDRPRRVGPAGPARRQAHRLPRAPRPATRGLAGGARPRGSCTRPRRQAPAPRPRRPAGDRPQSAQDRKGAEGESPALRLQVPTPPGPPRPADQYRFGDLPNSRLKALPTRSPTRSPPAPRRWPPSPRAAAGRRGRAACASAAGSRAAGRPPAARNAARRPSATCRRRPPAAHRPTVPGVVVHERQRRPDPAVGECADPAQAAGVVPGGAGPERLDERARRPSASRPGRRRSRPRRVPRRAAAACRAGPPPRVPRPDAEERRQGAEQRPHVVALDREAAADQDRVSAAQLHGAGRRPGEQAVAVVPVRGRVAGHDVGRRLDQQEGVARLQPVRPAARASDPAAAAQDGHELEQRLRAERQRPTPARLQPGAAGRCGPPSARGRPKADRSRPGRSRRKRGHRGIDRPRPRPQTPAAKENAMSEIQGKVVAITGRGERDRPGHRGAARGARREGGARGAPCRRPGGRRAADHR